MMFHSYANVYQRICFEERTHQEPFFVFEENMGSKRIATHRFFFGTGQSGSAFCSVFHLSICLTICQPFKLAESHALYITQCFNSPSMTNDIVWPAPKQKRSQDPQKRSAETTQNQGKVTYIHICPIMLLLHTYLCVAFKEKLQL